MGKGNPALPETYAMSDYEKGYRARVAGLPRAEGMNDDWHNGFNDAADDLAWRAMGCEQMQFGL